MLNAEVKNSECSVRERCKRRRLEKERIKSLKKILGIKGGELRKMLLTPGKLKCKDEMVVEDPYDQLPLDLPDVEKEEGKERKMPIVINRQAHVKNWSRRQWKARNKLKQEEIKKVIQESVIHHVERADQQLLLNSEGWRVLDEGLAPLRKRKWPEPVVIAGRKVKEILLDFIRSGKTGSVLIPWSELTSCHTLEAMDSMDDIPIMVPAVNMFRQEGNVLTKSPWLAFRIGGKERARKWREGSRDWWQNSDEKEKKELVITMAGNLIEPLKAQEVEMEGEELAVKLFKAVKDTITGECQPFASYTLPQDDKEEEEAIWERMAPPCPLPPAASKVPRTIQELKKAMTGKLKEAIDDEIVKVVWNYKEVFEEVVPGSVRPEDHCHRIDLNTSKELRAKIYPLRNEDQRNAAREEITRLLAGGMIQEVKSSAYQAPIVMAPKKSTDGKVKFRFCVDFRLLNQHTIGDSYPMPHLERQLDIGKARYFTKLDLASAFWQVQIAPEDRRKTVFHFEGRSYQWVVMPFGLKNSPPTFQRLIEKVLKDLLGNSVFAYIDDILIFTKTKEEHMIKLKEVLLRLRAAGLKVSMEKSEWCQTKVNYLGYVISEGKLQMDPKKVETIAKVPLPFETKEENGHYKPNLRKQVRRFLGAAGFYRKFIKDYATITAPLTDLTKTTERIKWTDLHTRCWRELQVRMMSYPVLIQPDSTKNSSWTPTPVMLDWEQL